LSFEVLTAGPPATFANFGQVILRRGRRNGEKIGLNGGLVRLGVKLLPGTEGEMPLLVGEMRCPVFLACTIGVWQP